MPTPVLVPALGESVTQAVLLRWVKNDGDKIAKDDIIAELETDKANVELNALAAGTLKTAAKAGDTVQVGQAIASLEDGSAAAAGRSAQGVRSRRRRAASRRAVSPGRRQGRRSSALGSAGGGREQA